MFTVADVASILEEFAPLRLAEAWDNVGLLIGERDAPIERVMTCLTITETTATEAIERGANLIVAHHPLPFQPLKQITSDTRTGRLLLRLVRARVAVYSPHTAFDSARTGINQHIATALGLVDIAPLEPAEALGDEELGAGRIGDLPGGGTFLDVLQSLRAAIPIDTIRIVGDEAAPVNRVGIACGSGGSLLEAALGGACDCFVTGEAGFHTCLDAEDAGVALALIGHFASEHFALHVLADYLSEQLPHVEVWASRTERDPVRAASS